MKRRPLGHHDFATRLTLARMLIARGASPAPIHLANQFAAAGVEARGHHDRIAAVLPVLEPDRHWRQRIDTSPPDDVRAYLLAAVLDCTTVCIHLRRGGPQPAFFQLPLRRADCTRCVGTIRRSPADEADRCDLCGARGVVIFQPFAVRLGPTLVVGDACRGCAHVLGIMDAAS
ncbi:MAG TPA: hypothetical protein VFH48_29200 [Chloroflexota bacterium]|nr:hypothetical protein [Chloroflexota bacterium]